MPIDRTGRSRSSASRRTSRKPGRAPSGGPGSPTAISPATSRSSSAQGGHQSGHARRAAPLPGRAGRPRPPGRAPGPRVGVWRWPAPPPDAPHRLPARHQRSQTGHLVALDGPEEVPLRRRSRVVGHRGGLGHQLVGVVLPHHRQPGSQGRAHGLGPEPLGDRHQGHRRRVGRRRLDAGPDAGQPLLEARERSRRAHVPVPGAADHTSEGLASGVGPGPVGEPPASAGRADADPVDHPGAGAGRPRRRPWPPGRAPAGRPSWCPGRSARRRPRPGRGRPGRTRSTGRGCTARAPPSPRSPPGSAWRATAASTTPATSPRQPACTAPKTPSGLARAMRRAVGGQDAQGGAGRRRDQGVVLAEVATDDGPPARTRSVHRPRRRSRGPG